jgi:hypothetical protein
MYAENTYFRKGYSTNGDILYNWDGTYLRKGYSSNGDILYNVDISPNIPNKIRDQRHTACRNCA